MERNLFLSLFKYRPNFQMLPEENFITESFVYILNQSLFSNRIVFNEFIKLLEFVGIDKFDYKTIKIETQRIFELSDNTIAIPDITITINKILIIIEVKVTADLNQYEDKSKEGSNLFNQIEKYQKIKSEKKIYALTLRKIIDNITAKDYAKNILWNDIYKLLSNYLEKDNSNFLINDFVHFLFLQNMIIPKITKEISDCSYEIHNLITLLEMALRDLSYTKTISDGRFYRGFNVTIPKVKCIVWVGYLYKDSAIKMQIITPELNNYFSNLIDSIYLPDPDNPDYILVSGLYINNVNFINKSSEEQLNIIIEWIKNSIDKLTKNLTNK